MQEKSPKTPPLFESEKRERKWKACPQATHSHPEDRVLSSSRHTHSHPVHFLPSIIGCFSLLHRLRRFEDFIDVLSFQVHFSRESREQVRRDCGHRCFHGRRLISIRKTCECEWEGKWSYFSCHFFLPLFMPLFLSMITDCAMIYQLEIPSPVHPSCDSSHPCLSCSQRSIASRASNSPVARKVASRRDDEGHLVVR